MTAKYFAALLVMAMVVLSASGADRMSDQREEHSQQSAGLREDSQKHPDSIEWLIQAIRRLPSDEPVAEGHPGYNNYRTQKDHWLGWLDPDSGTGTYPRKDASDRDARYVYNHIVEPKMLLWLISASGVRQELVEAAEQAAEAASSLAGKSAAIRKQVPWAEVAAALSARESGKGKKPPDPPDNSKSKSGGS
ncbi:MAG: hypothetical protein AB7T27_11400 [Kiritimatiellia bacterium]